eukprot:g88.t1
MMKRTIRERVPTRARIVALFLVSLLGGGEAIAVKRKDIVRIITPEGVQIKGGRKIVKKSAEGCEVRNVSASKHVVESDFSLLPFVRAKEIRHCDESALTEIEEADIRNFVQGRMSSIPVHPKCIEEVAFELREEWIHANRPHLCNWKKYEIPTFDDQSFLSPPFNSVKSVRNLVRIAYFIVAYRQPRFLRRLVRRIQTQDRRHLILIHIDVHSKPEFEFDVLTIAREYSNVRVVRWGAIVYGSSTAVQIISAAMRWFLDAHDGEWDFFAPLTGQDYPLLSPSNFAETLRRAGSRTWIIGEDMHYECASSYSLPLSPSLAAQWGRVTSLHYPCTIGGLRSLYRYKNRVPWLFIPSATSSSSSSSANETDFHVAFCKGTSMSTGIFHRSAVAMLTRDARALKAYAFFRLALVPEEHYWVAVLSALGTFEETRPTSNDSSSPLLLRRTPCEMSWVRGHGADGLHNTFLTMAERDIVDHGIETGRLFARKFDESVDSDILDYIDSLG